MHITEQTDLLPPGRPERPVRRLTGRGRPSARPLPLRRLWLLTLLPVGGILLAAARGSTAFAEWYAVRVYPALSGALGLLTGLFPFSLCELLLVLLIPALLLWTVRLVRSILPRRGSGLCPDGGVRWKGFLARSGIWLAAAVSCIWLAYVLLCGINYSRQTYSYHSGLTLRESDSGELALLCEELIQNTNAARERVLEDEEGCMRLSRSVERTAQAARDSYKRLGESQPVLSGIYGRVKPVFFSRLMSYTGITGVYFPFTVEANVNVDIPAYSIPSTMCHELTHLKGFMREDEANFIGYLACVGSDNPDFVYSGYALAVIHSMNALYQADYDAFARLAQTYSPAVLRDFEANSAYWKGFEGPVSEISDAVNDGYLKANQQTDGVQSYGRMVDLLLADYRSRHGLT